MGFIPRAGIEEYAKLFTDPEEYDAHIGGKEGHLSGLVYKTLDRAVHLYKDFKIPADWMRIEAVDPHDARPTRWLFAAVSPEDIQINGKPANRIYVYAYLLANGNVEEIARQVKVKRAEHNYYEPAFVVLDRQGGNRAYPALALRGRRHCLGAQAGERIPPKPLLHREEQGDTGADVCRGRLSG